ncbi:MAG: hypothetical protein V3W41_20925 [Planctomycetota bacterium]
MKTPSILFSFLILALALPCGAQVGNPAPTTKLEGFTQTKAKALGDYVGRALVVEFFAFW